MFEERRQKLIDEANHIIDKAITRFDDDLALACSFGKDSMVVLDLALKQKPNILVAWNNTLIEYPETVKFAKKIVDDWGLNFIENRPFVTFWDIVDEFGFPTPNNRKCCDFLKLYPIRFLYNELEIKATMTGLRRDESRLRQNLPLEGEDSQLKGIYRYNPIVNFTEMDIWDYHIEYNLPMNNVYMKGLKRTGCLYCTVGASFGALKLVQNNYPRRWKRMSKMLENDAQFIPNKDGTFRITKDFPKIKHSEVNLKKKVSEGMIKRMHKGEVFRYGKNFNRGVRLPSRPFI